MNTFTTISESASSDCFSWYTTTSATFPWGQNLRESVCLVEEMVFWVVFGGFLGFWTGFLSRMNEIQIMNTSYEEIRELNSELTNHLL